MLSQTKAGFIVESLVDGKRFPVFAHERVSSLEEISIFTTTEEDLPLKEVFRKISGVLEGKAAPDAGSDSETLKKFFLQAIPEYDPERVYVSDIKKALSWYNLLNEKGLMDLSDEKAEEVKAEETENPEEINKETENKE